MERKLKKWQVEYATTINSEERQLLEPMEDAFIKAFFYQSLFWDVYTDDKGRRYLRVFPYSDRAQHLDQFTASDLKRIDPERLTGYVLSRVTVRPEQMGGAPCVRGLRIPVATVVGMVADGMSHDEILKHYPDLEEEDIRQCLRFAAEAVREREIPLVSPT